MQAHTFKDMVLSHEGKRFAICGGGSSLEDDLAQINADVYISANEHGVRVRSCDYVVAMDTRNGAGREMGGYLREFTDAPIISPCEYADVIAHSWPHAPRRVYSGLVASWIAYAMGAKVIFLCGFDAYGQTPGAVRKARLFVDGIRCEVREVGGRMGVWPEYRQGERFRYVRHPELETLKGAAGMTRVMAIKPTRLTCGPIGKGEERDVMRDDRIIAKLLAHGILQEVG